MDDYAPELIYLLLGLVLFCLWIMLELVDWFRWKD